MIIEFAVTTASQARGRSSHRLAADSNSRTAPAWAIARARSASDGGNAFDRSALLSVIIDTG